MKRLLALVLCALCLSSTAFAAAATGTAKIGGGSAGTVTIDMHSGVTADVALAQGVISKDQNAADIIHSAKTKGNLIAAVNGGFFNAYYATQPEAGYGAAARCQVNLVKDGRVINGGAGDQTAIYLGFTKDGKALIDEVGVTLYVEHSGKKLPTWGVNYYYPEEPNSLLLFTPEAGADLPVPANARAAKIVNGKVTEILDSGKCVCAENTYYFVAGKNLYDRLPGVGATVTFSTEFDKSAWKDVTTAVSCGPWLLHDGKNVFSENSKYSYLADQKVSETAVAGRTFAAILPNGDLMLSACTASPKQITEYLQSLGATDAMLLDGGASSMLYANGNTLRSAGRKLNNVIAIYEAAQSAAPTASNTAYESTQAIELDGKKIILPAYQLRYDGGVANYVRLRDLAQILNGTAAQFDVTWLASSGAVNIVNKHAYDHPNGSEGNVPFSGPQTYSDFNGDTLIDGKVSGLNAFSIYLNGGGNTYYQLRDLGQKLGFNVGWSGDRGIFIETDKPYSDAN